MPCEEVEVQIHKFLIYEMEATGHLHDPDSASIPYWMKLAKSLSCL
jgi:hypothetical protein